MVNRIVKNKRPVKKKKSNSKKYLIVIFILVGIYAYIRFSTNVNKTKISNVRLYYENLIQ